MYRFTLFFTCCSLLLLGCSERALENPAHIGYVEAEWVYSTPAQAGIIQDQLVREGDPIKAGAPLYRLDAEAQKSSLAEAEARLMEAKMAAADLNTGARNEELDVLRANLSDAKARLNKARVDRDRTPPLIEKGLAPSSRMDEVVTEYDRATAGVEIAQRNIQVAELAARPARREGALAAVDAAQAARDRAAYLLSQRTVYATAAGRVERRILHTGEFANAGSPVLAILPEAGLKTVFFVAQAELPQLQTGQTIQIQADGLKQPVSGQISYIAKTAEFTPPVIYSKDARGSLVFRVEALLPPHTGLQPGLPVDVHW